MSQSTDNTFSPQENHIASSEKKSSAIQTEQPVKPQRPMSIDEYIKALRKEAEVAKLRATVAKSMFEENMAMAQLNQLRAGQFQAATQAQSASPSEDNKEESTDKIATD